MAMRPVTAIEIAAGAAERWRKQYAGWSPEDKFWDGTTKADTDDALNNCQHSPENIARILNDGWAYPRCSSCGDRRNVVIEFRGSFSDETYMLCIECISRAHDQLNQFPNAASPIPLQSRKE